MTRARPFLDPRKRELFVMDVAGEKKRHGFWKFLGEFGALNRCRSSLDLMHGPLAKAYRFYILFPAAQQKIYYDQRDLQPRFYLQRNHSSRFKLSCEEDKLKCLRQQLCCGALKSWPRRRISHYLQRVWITKSTMRQKANQ
jgi:hypothetical protein